MRSSFYFDESLTLSKQSEDKTNAFAFYSRSCDLEGIPIVIQKLGVCQGDPQNFCLEKETIAGRQGSSENRNSEDESTKAKTNF